MKHQGPTGSLSGDAQTPRRKKRKKASGMIRQLSTTAEFESSVLRHATELAVYRYALTNYSQLEEILFQKDSPPKVWLP